MFSQGTDLYDLVAQSLPTHAIVLLDSDFVVQSWNDGAVRLTGISADQAIGKPFTRLTMPEGASSRGAALQTARLKGRFEHEGWWSQPDGSRCWVDEVIAPVLDDGELIGYVDIARDRADAHAIEGRTASDREAVYARLYREAQEANRAKADFLAIVSHELRTPLNAIMGYSDIIDTGISGPVTENQRRQLARIRTSARHLLQIIEEILSYARLESGGLEVDYEKTTVGTIADEAAAITHPVAAGKGLVLKLVLPKSDQPFVTDPSKVRQVLVNLLSNAIKFTERGTIHLEASIDGSNAVYVVRDTGVGMSKDQLEKIFDPFWQIEQPTTRHAGGTGLGLSVARRFADLLGGSIQVESTPQVGSNFELCFPLQPAQIK